MDLARVGVGGRRDVSVPAAGAATLRAIEFFATRMSVSSATSIRSGLALLDLRDGAVDPRDRHDLVARPRLRRISSSCSRRSPRADADEVDQPDEDQDVDRQEQRRHFGGHLARAALGDRVDARPARPRIAKALGPPRRQAGPGEGDGSPRGTVSRRDRRRPHRRPSRERGPRDGPSARSWPSSWPRWPTSGCGTSSASPPPSRRSATPRRHRRGGGRGPLRRARRSGVGPRGSRWRVRRHLDLHAGPHGGFVAMFLWMVPGAVASMRPSELVLGRERPGGHRLLALPAGAASADRSGSTTPRRPASSSAGRCRGSSPSATSSPRPCRLMHVGYTPLFAPGLTHRGSRWRWVVSRPAAMLYVVMATANHWWLDAVGGAACVPRARGRRPADAVAAPSLGDGVVRIAMATEYAYLVLGVAPSTSTTSARRWSPGGHDVTVLDEHAARDAADGAPDRRREPSPQWPTAPSASGSRCLSTNEARSPASAQGSARSRASPAPWRAWTSSTRRGSPCPPSACGRSGCRGRRSTSAPSTRTSRAGIGATSTSSRT